MALCKRGSARVPRYDLAASARTGTHCLDLGEAPCFIAEGVFAPDIVAGCRSAGVLVEALFLARSRNATLVLRFLRDLSERRKPPLVLVRRGLARWRAEPEIRRHAIELGCRPVSMREALAIARQP